jgi:hypothetical protein
MPEPQESGLPNQEPGSANPVISGAVDDQQTSLDPALAATVNDLVDKKIRDMNLDEMMDRKAQSQKDRRFSSQERDIADNKTDIQRIREKMTAGLDFEKATEVVAQEDRNAAVDSLLKERDQNQESLAKTNLVDDTVVQILAASKLEANDPGVQKILNDNPGVERVGKLLEYASQRTSSVSGAGSFMPSSTGPTPDPDLQAEYDAEIKKVRGQPMAIADLKIKYREKGLKDLW